MFLSNIYFFAQTVISQAVSANKFKQSAEKKPCQFPQRHFYNTLDFIVNKYA